MNAQEDHSQANFAQVAPVLDEAISQLAPEEQSAIVLRFFEQLDLSSVGEALGSTEEAARKRVNRALGKLHALLTARGVTLSAAALGVALADRAVQAAPAGLVGSLAKAAWTSAGAGHGTTFFFLKHVMTSKIGVGVAGAVVLAGAAWLSWRQWWPWWPAKPPPLALNGTWTRLDKPQPLGHIVSGECFALDPDGQLYVPEPHGESIAMDRQGNLYVVDWQDWKTRRLSFGRLYVSDPAKKRVQVRDVNGKWSELGHSGIVLNYPGGVAVGLNGAIYVTDTPRVLCWTPQPTGKTSAAFSRKIFVRF